jgi:RNA polymerase sigma-70 factor (ECF subfamily)
MTPSVPVAPDPDPASPPTDRSLIRRYRAGREEAATALYRRYARRLRQRVRMSLGNGFAGRFDADDVTQSVFRTFFDGVKRAAYDAPDGRAIWALLVAIAVNKTRNMIDLHTAARRDVRASVPTAEFDPAHIYDRDQEAETFLRLVVAERLDALPCVSREIVRLRLEGYLLEEIAARTDRSLRTVERVLQVFRDRLSDR